MLPRHVNVLLMGLRGSGKSTLGRALAARCDRDFVDLDVITLSLLGASSATQAWQTHGEAAFRRAEVIALARALTRDGQVIALGGGTPTAPGAAALLQEARAAGRSHLVYLKASVATLQARLEEQGPTDRPSLTGADPVQEVVAVLAAREPLYLQLADEVISVDGAGESAILQGLATLVGAAKN